MKNYLVKAIYEIESADWTIADRSSETDLDANYRAMHDLSVESFRQHLGGEWELRVIEDRVETIHHAFEKTFWYIHDLWHSEPCNILYTDADTLAIAPVDMWADFNQYMMFNSSDPKIFAKFNRWRKKFLDFFDTAVQYFPATMTQETWDTGLAIAEEWDHNNYHTKKIVANSMLWEQGIPMKDAKHAELLYQAKWMPHLPVKMHDSWNTSEFDQAKIVHVHARKNSAERLEFMKTLIKD